MHRALRLPMTFICIDLWHIISSMNSAKQTSTMVHKYPDLYSLSFDPNPLVRSSFWTVSLGLTINWIAGMGVGQTNLQRFLSVPNLKSARR